MDGYMTTNRLNHNAKRTAEAVADVVCIRRGVFL